MLLAAVHRDAAGGAGLEVVKMLLASATARQRAGAPPGRSGGGSINAVINSALVF